MTDTQTDNHTSRRIKTYKRTDVPSCAMLQTLLTASWFWLGADVMTDTQTDNHTSRRIKTYKRTDVASCAMLQTLPTVIWFWLGSDLMTDIRGCAALGGPGAEMEARLSRKALGSGSAMSSTTRPEDTEK